MSAKRYGLNYTTPWGVDLAAFGKSGGTTFLIHDSGLKLLQDEWHDNGVNSPFWRLYHNFTPGGFVRHQGVSTQLIPESVALVPENTTFDYYQQAPTLHLWLHFTLTRPMPDLLKGPTFVPVDPLFLATLGELKQLHSQPQSDLRDQRLYHLSASLVHLTLARLDIELGHRMPDKLREVLEMIHQSSRSDLSNTFLAAHAGMCVEKFIRWFREHLGQTPACYVTQVRIRLACEALALTSKTVDEIALELGFANRNYFSRVFTAQIGCGPAEFRHRQNDLRGM